MDYLRILAAAVILTFFAAPAMAQVAPAGAPADYTQWRGHNRDGAASAFKTPRAWPETLTRGWKVEIGTGYATPLLVGDRLYTLTRQDDREVMTALEAATGKTLWRTAYPAPYKTKPGTAYHGDGPKSTPLYYDGKLFTLGIGGIVSAFEAGDGTLLWQHPASLVDPNFGTAMSPVADGRLVIFHVGGNDQGALTAFDIDTGATRWAWAGDGPSYGSPMIVEIAGVRQVVAITQGHVVGVDVATGMLLWQRPLVALALTNSFTPIVIGDIVVVSAHDAGVSAFRVMTRDNRWSTETVWETKDVEMKLSNPVVVNNTLYGFSHKNSGQLFALDPTTGQILWRGKERDGTHASFVKAGDIFFVLNDEGVLTVARDSRTGFEPVRSYTVADSATWAQPTISGNRIFVKDVSTLALWTVD